MNIPDLLPHEFEAVLGKTGSGKSNRAKIAVEAWIGQGRRVGIIDVTDAWWGLKLRADGKTPAHDVVIFGGRHADVDLAPAMAAPLGQMLAKATFPWILCTAKLGENAMRAFLSDFFEALYLHLESPLHLIMDEADEYAPQTTTGAIGELFGRVDRIVRRGRVKGFRIMMLTQRPAALNKNILAQADRLTAFKLTLPHDHAAIEGWIKGHGDKKRGQQVLDTLSGLKVGNAWVWAPEHGLLERVAFPLAKTFDSGRSPDGSVTAPVTALKPADLERLKTQLGAVIEEAKANDPRLLKAEVARLQAELRRAQAQPQAVAGATPAEVEAARCEGHEIGFRSGVSDTTRRIRNTVDLTVRKAARAVSEANSELGLFLGSLDSFAAEGEKIRPPATPTKPAAPAPQRTTSRAPAPKSSTPTEGLTGPMQRILDAIDWWVAVGVPAPKRVQVAMVARYAPEGGAFLNPLGGLRSAGLIDYPEPGSVRLTDAGAAKARGPQSPPTTADLHDRVRAVINGPQWRILEPLLEFYPNAMDRASLAQCAGYAPEGGAFLNPLGSLRTLGLITYPQPGFAAALPVLFVER